MSFKNPFSFRHLYDKMGDSVKSVPAGRLNGHLCNLHIYAFELRNRHPQTVERKQTNDSISGMVLQFFEFIL